MANMEKAGGLTAVKKVFEPLYKRQLSNDEAFEINQNMIGFFELLLKLEQEQKQNNEERN